MTMKCLENEILNRVQDDEIIRFPIGVGNDRNIPPSVVLIPVSLYDARVYITWHILTGYIFYAFQNFLIRINRGINR